jgi:hypothetical protein
MAARLNAINHQLLARIRRFDAFEEWLAPASARLFAPTVSSKLKRRRARYCRFTRRWQLDLDAAVGALV